MSELELKVGFWEKYDHIRGLIDGRVEIEGVSTEFEGAPIISITFRNTPSSLDGFSIESDARRSR